MNKLFRKPALTSRRIRFAYIAAILADGIQLALGPFGWAFADELIDVIAMILTTRLIGFHPLLLPTFIAELVPIVDFLPTWTGCVAVVIAIRRKRERDSMASPENLDRADVIDV
ncbi:MAG TPA: hypothetical protein VFM25_14340 [Verrucomicrobiae bacterium]|nr:hypothetical protein [Verrucomicrobiae bacterium]